MVKEPWTGVELCGTLVQTSTLRGVTGAGLPWGNVFQHTEDRIVLILSRKQGEVVILRVPGYPDVKVQVTRIERAGRTVRLGFAADPRIGIYRTRVPEEKEEGLNVCGGEGSCSPSA